MEKAEQICAERKIGAEDHKFILFFLNDDEDQSVHVEEVEDVDFLQVLLHINLGGSVFITHRKKPKHNISCNGCSLRDQCTLTKFKQGA